MRFISEDTVHEFWEAGRRMLEKKKKKKPNRGIGGKINNGMLTVIRDRL